MEHKIWTPCRVWGGWLGLAPRSGSTKEALCPEGKSQVCGSSHQNECRMGEETPRFRKQVFRGGPVPAFP